MKTRLQHYDIEKKQFETIKGAQVANIYDAVNRKIDTFSPEMPVYIMATIYDTIYTTNQALAIYASRFSNLHALIENSPKAIKSIVDINPRVKVVLNSRIQTRDTGMDTGISNDQWFRERTHLAIGSGCVGMLVDFSPTELQGEEGQLPDLDYFRLFQDYSVRLNDV